MKTTKFRLLAMIITLAAVITIASTPTYAQRRSTSDNHNNRKVEKLGTQTVPQPVTLA